MKNKILNNQKKVVIFLISVLLFLDQIVKVYIHFNGKDFKIAQNTEGINNRYVIIISIIVVILIVKYISNKNNFIKMDSKILLSFAIAGIISNLIDIVWNGYVINYIKIGKYIEFNISYIYIWIAWIGMAIIYTKNIIQILKKKKIKR